MYKTFDFWHHIQIQNIQLSSYLVYGGIKVYKHCCLCFTCYPSSSHGVNNANINIGIVHSCAFRRSCFSFHLSDFYITPTDTHEYFRIFNKLIRDTTSEFLLHHCVCAQFKGCSTVQCKEFRTTLCMLKRHKLWPCYNYALQSISQNFTFASKMRKQSLAK